MIELFAGITFLSILVFSAKNYRNKNFSVKCPKCGNLCKPHTTGLKDSCGPIYSYKCKCGWKHGY